MEHLEEIIPTNKELTRNEKRNLSNMVESYYNMNIPNFTLALKAIEDGVIDYDNNVNMIETEVKLIKEAIFCSKLTEEFRINE